MNNYLVWKERNRWAFNGVESQDLRFGERWIVGCIFFGIVMYIGGSWFNSHVYRRKGQAEVEGE